MGLFSSTHHHHHKSSTEYVPYEKKVTVHEHKAPTDQSIELLNEMTEKAKQNIVDSIHIKNNIIDCALIYFQDDITTDSLRYVVRFKLNGKEYKLDGRIERFELMEQGRAFHYRHEGVMMLVYKKYAEVIASELIRLTPDTTRALAGI